MCTNGRKYLGRKKSKAMEENKTEAQGAKAKATPMLKAVLLAEAMMRANPTGKETLHANLRAWARKNGGKTQV